MSIAPPHALLVAYWGTEGGAVLSIPTKEYFQSSGWVEERRMTAPRVRKPRARQNGALNPDSVATSVTEDIRSVRTGSDFWADGRSRSPSSSAYTARDNSGYMDDSFSKAETSVAATSLLQSRYEEKEEDDDDNDSQATEVPDEDVDDSIVDEVGAQDAFVTGMIYALSRKIVPGPPYTPSAGGENTVDIDNDRGRWRQLDECLRYAFHMYAALECSQLMPMIPGSLQSSLVARLDVNTGTAWPRRWLELGGSASRVEESMRYF